MQKLRGERVGDGEVEVVGETALLLRSNLFPTIAFRLSGGIENHGTMDSIYALWLKSLFR